MNSQDIVIYSAPGIELALPLDRDRETVWASSKQIEELFGIDQSGVSRHIRNVFGDAEVDAESNMQILHTTRVGRPEAIYSLDVILAVGYRVSSGRAIEFRKWASSVLRGYLIDGYALNEQRLDQLGAIVRVLGRATDELVVGVAEVLSRYLPSLQLLRDYDEGRIDAPSGVVPGWTLTIDEAREIIARVGAEFPADALFGGERGEALRGVIGAIYQGFGGQELYPSVQEKAANLLYLIVKDHPLSDGNKRSAAALFVHFLAKNGQLFDERGESRISNNALAAITLMIALLTRMLAEEGR